MGDSGMGKSISDADTVSMSGRVMFAAVILLFLTIVFVLFLHLYAKWFWGRNGSAARTQTRRRRFVFSRDRDSVLAPRRGLEPSAIRSLPVLIFNPSEFKDGLECAVCLCELADGEKARLLPKCNHGFHLDCIDMWFQSHSTCPLCRNLVVPDACCPDSDEEEIRVPGLNSNDGHSTESPNFPTNVLFWGNQDQVSTGGSLAVEEGPSSSSSSSSTSSSTKSEGSGMLVIDIPRQLTENFAFPSPSSSLRFPDEELKSPTATRLRSLKRLLGREKRVVPSSPTAVDVEQGGNSQNTKAPSSDP